MRPRRRPGEVPPPPNAESINIDGMVGPPVYHIPMPPPTRVVPVAGGEWIIGTASPPMNPEQFAAWCAARRKKPGLDPNRRLMPVAVDIKPLPRWARVAFAARCSRRVLPLFRHFWPSAPVDRVRAIATAVEFAEQAAATLAVSCERAREVTRAAERAAHGSRSRGASSVAACCGAAARVAPSTRPLGVAHGPQLAYELLVRVATLSTARIVTAPARDLDRLSCLAVEQKWNDDTPVPPQVFGPMWDREPPPWWRDDVLAKLPPELETKNPDPADTESGPR